MTKRSMTKRCLTQTEIAGRRADCRKALNPQRVGKRRAETIAQYVKALELLVEEAMPYVWRDIERQSS